MERNLAAIVIPVYYSELDSFDRISLSRCFNLWGNKFDIFFVKPESLDLSSVLEKYSPSRVVSFDDHFFKDIKGYNKLMLSPFFYKQFLEYEYIFLYQTDGYIFKDELVNWCKKGYDYIGAPWIPKEKKLPRLNKVFTSCRRFINKLQGHPDRSEQYYKVGNGGVSLRKTSVFYNTAIADKTNIDKYVSRLGKSSMYNEDVYWSLARKKGSTEGLRIPGYKEALGFSFDMNPDICYKKNNNKLPFCCHGFSKPKFYPFWKKFININTYD